MNMDYHEEQASYKQKLLSAKLKVKEWETEYTASHGCHPSKEALLDAPSDVRKAYKFYFHYRKGHLISKAGGELAVSMKACDQQGTCNEIILGKGCTPKEDSLSNNSNDISTENNQDEINLSLENSQGESKESCKKQRNGETPSDIAVSFSEHQSEPLVTSNVNEKQAPPVSVWGRHLNKSDQPEKYFNNESKEASLYSKMAKKLSENGMVKKRLRLTPGNSIRKSKQYRTSNVNLLPGEEKCENTNNDMNIEVIDMLKPQNKNENVSEDTSVTVPQLKEFECLTFKIHKKEQNTNSGSIPVNFLAHSENDFVAEKYMKKVLDLDAGWLSRSIGIDSNPEISIENSLSNERWKMKLLDHEHTQDDDEKNSNHQKSTVFQSESSVFNENNRKTLDNNSLICDDIKKRAKCTNSKLYRHSREKTETNFKVCSELGGVEGVSIVNCKIREKPTGVQQNECFTSIDSKNGNITVNDNTDSVSESVLKVYDDPYNFEDSPMKRAIDIQYIDNNVQTGETVLNNHIPPHDDHSESSEELAGRKRKKMEDLDEMEKEGKIKSSWPPPKRVRKARKPDGKSVLLSRKANNNSRSATILHELARQETENMGTRKRKYKKTREKENSEVTPYTNDTSRAVRTSSRQRTKKRMINYSTHDKSEGNITHSDCSGNEKNPIIKHDYNELEDIETNGKKSTITKSYTNKENCLSRKIATGAASNNYVRVNLKKKIYVRGKKSTNFSKYKRKEWQKKQKSKIADEGESGTKTFTCFRCGDFGHWAKDCPGKKGDTLLALTEYDEQESSFLTLEEATALALGIKPSTHPMSKSYLGNAETSAPISQKVESLTKNLNPVEAELQTVDYTVNEKHVNARDRESDLPCDRKVLGDSNPEEDDLDDETLTNYMNSFDTQEQTTLMVQEVAQSSQLPMCERPKVDPLYELEDGEVGPTHQEVFDTLKMFGYSAFRSGQEKAIMRILSGLSTLLVLSTGSGKSLCYQLPAYLYSKYRKCITLCISPLISLMEDQLTGLPQFLRAVCLHTHQNNTQRASALAAIRSGNAHILIVSPESIVGSQTGGILGSLLKDLPPVAFACLDEAHCVSEWSHNFRPSYLRVCQVLREKLGVETILGLTATARQAAATSIAQHLNIFDLESGIIRGASVPKNLSLSVSRDVIREEALITLLKGERFANCSSIIIYCTRRDECERIASLIRSQLLVPSKINVKNNMKKSRSISFDAEAYHAGLSSYRRQQVQKQFMSGKLRIVVATIAFGMGIDKSDIRGIIHFNMPKNVESFVQEIGRAGRDGEEAHCHLFLDANDGKDIQELKRHIYAHSLDRHTVRKFLSQIFRPCACVKLNALSSDIEKISPSNDSLSSHENFPDVLSSKTEHLSDVIDSFEDFPMFKNSQCPKHEVAIPINDLVEKLDLPEENLETMLCYLELHWGNLLKLTSHVYATCTVLCYGGPHQLVAISRRCPPLAVAIALAQMNGENFEKSNKITFPVVEVASRMGWNSKIVKRELKALEWNTLNLASGGQIRKSGVTVEFSDLSFHMEVRGDICDDDRDRLLDALYKRIQLREKEQLRQLQFTYSLLQSVSHKSIFMCCDDFDVQRCEKLREGLSSYFAKEGKTLSDVGLEEQIYINPDVERQIHSSIRAFLSIHTDHQWNGRALARIFHGIGSPNFPSKVWGRVRRFWRQHLNTDFNLLVSIATQEILRSR